jgi:hypothetical protein
MQQPQFEEFDARSAALQEIAQFAQQDFAGRPQAAGVDNLGLEVMSRYETFGGDERGAGIRYPT